MSFYHYILQSISQKKKKSPRTFLVVGPVVKNLPCNARDVGSTPSAGRTHML